eukprot:c28263_g1_i1 orf=401-2995(-)
MLEGFSLCCCFLVVCSRGDLERISLPTAMAESMKGVGFDPAAAAHGDLETEFSTSETWAGRELGGLHAGATDSDMPALELEILEADVIGESGEEGVAVLESVGSEVSEFGGRELRGDSTKQKGKVGEDGDEREGAYSSSSLKGVEFTEERRALKTGIDYTGEREVGEGEFPTLRRRKLSLKEPGKNIAHLTEEVDSSRSPVRGSQKQIYGMHAVRDDEYLQRARELQDILSSKIQHKTMASSSFDRPGEDPKLESEISTTALQDRRRPSEVDARSSWPEAYDSKEGGVLAEEIEEGDSQLDYGTQHVPPLTKDAKLLDTRTHFTDGRAGLNVVHEEGDALAGREVYRMPNQDSEDQLPSMLWPTGWVVQVLCFQMRLLWQLLSAATSFVDLGYSFVAKRLEKTKEARDKATEAVSQRLTIISQVPPKVTEGGSIMARKIGWGCLAVTYVCILLSSLLFLAFLMNFFFVSKFVEEPFNMKDLLHFDYTQYHPSAVVYLQPSSITGHYNGKLLHQPSKSQRSRAIPMSHLIHITVTLTLPESDYNRQLGVFQLSAELLSVDGEMIFRSSRPCMLQFQSVPVRLTKTFLLGLPLLVGLVGESQTLVVPLLEYREQLIPTKSVRILLQPKAGFPMGAGIPEIYSAEIHIQSHLPWLKHLVLKWKWTFYVWSCLTLYVLVIMAVLCCCRHVIVPKTWISRTEEDLSSKANDNSGHIPARELHTHKPQDNRERRRQNRGKRRVYFEDDLPTANASRDFIPESSTITDSGQSSSEGHLLGQGVHRNGVEELGEQPVEGSSGYVTVESLNVESLSRESNESLETEWVMPPMEEILESMKESALVVDESLQIVGETVAESITGSSRNVLQNKP